MREAEGDTEGVMDPEAVTEGVLIRALGLPEARSVREMTGEAESTESGVTVGCPGVALGTPPVEDTVEDGVGEGSEERVAPSIAMDRVGG